MLYIFLLKINHNFIKKENDSVQNILLGSYNKVITHKFKKKFITY